MSGGELEFVNRERELAFLLRCLREPPAPGALVVVRAPSGFGKSRLVNRLLAEPELTARRVCAVDPQIRTGLTATRLHEGFFLQRTADAFDEAARTRIAPWPTLQAFLKQRRWKTAAERPKEELLNEIPSVETLYKVAFGYATRLLGLGAHGAKALLQSDEADAVRICREYAQAVMRSYAPTLLIREAQHIDLESLEALLNIEGAVDLLFEYTSEAGGFAPEHHKAFLRAAAARGAIAILDLVKLELSHLERLLREYVRQDVSLPADAHLVWNGNLHSVEELRFRVGVGMEHATGPAIAGVLAHVARSLAEHIQQLSALQRLVLAILVAHLEAIEAHVLTEVAGRVDGAVRAGLLQEAVSALETVHGFICRSAGGIALDNETVATAISETPGMSGLVALAERALRDHYQDLVAAGDYAAIGMSRAVRQVFRLCARTRDASGLVAAVRAFSGYVASARDQLVYVDAVADAIDADPELYGDDHDVLLTWAASLAYGVSDWDRAARLIASRRTRDIFGDLLQASALPEVGRHQQASDLARDIASQAVTNDARVAAEALDAMIVGCLGAYDDARRRLDELVADPRNQSSPLLGYAYRFYEVVDGFVEALPKLLTSIELFERAGFAKSKAYSQLPAAMYLARMGDVAGARQFLVEAETVLAPQIRDQHLLLNNRAAVELLAEDVDPARCVELLKGALRSARDDYSETTILTNLALAHWRAGDLTAAVECASRAMHALADHDFADQDTYWPVCFNAAQVFAAAGDLARAEETRAFPALNGKPPSVNRSYWAYRYGEADKVEGVYAFLTGHPYHPLYLSHWVIDLEGLEVLKPERPGSIAHSSTPSP